MNLSPAILPAPESVSLTVAAPKSRPDVYLQVLLLLSRGWNNSAIARAVGVDRETVRNYASLVQFEIERAATSDWAAFKHQIGDVETTGNCFIQPKHSRLLRKIKSERPERPERSTEKISVEKFP